VDLPLPRTAEALTESVGNVAERGYPWLDHQRIVGAEQLPGPRWDLRTVRMKPFIVPVDGEPTLAAMMQRIRDHVAALDAEYVVVGIYEPWRFLHPAPTAFRIALAERGQLVARISPDGAPPEWTRAIDYQDDLSPDTPPWAWRVLLARRTGPTVEIYALR
jgi:hypothetical protein